MGSAGGDGPGRGNNGRSGPWKPFRNGTRQKYATTQSRGGLIMNAGMPKELEQIHWLYYEFIDAINRGQVTRQTALDALEYTLEDLLSEVCDSEERVGQYFDILRDRALGTWRRQNKHGNAVVHQRGAELERIVADGRAARASG